MAASLKTVIKAIGGGVRGPKNKLILHETVVCGGFNAFYRIKK